VSTTRPIYDRLSVGLVGGIYTGLDIELETELCGGLSNELADALCYEMFDEPATTATDDEISTTLQAKLGNQS